jgi:hypothetical protein
MLFAVLPLILAMAHISFAQTSLFNVAFTNSTNFFNSTGWTSAPSGANFTENFVASGGVYNFTGNESFRSQTFSYGSGGLSNAMTIQRTDGASSNIIAVDTSNGSFNSFDAPGSSKYLWTTHSNGKSEIKFSFSQGINAFSLRMGDFADALGTTSLYMSTKDTNGSLVGYSYATQSLSGFEQMGFVFGNVKWTFLGWTFDTPISEFVIGSDWGDDNWAIDTVSFSTVPEPSALSLLAVGLGGLAAIRRRRS